MPIFVKAIGSPDGNKLGLISAAYALGGIPGFMPGKLTISSLVSFSDIFHVPSWMTKTLLCMLSLMTASWVADKYGRRLCMTIGALTIICGSMVQTFTKGGNQLLAGRLIVGLGSAFQGVGAVSLARVAFGPPRRIGTSFRCYPLALGTLCFRSCSP